MFLDASKAFDLVDHFKLFQKLKARGLPSPILRFLSSSSFLIHFVFLMVLDRVVYFLLFYFLFIWMVYWRNCLILVLVVIGALCLLVLFVMRMILFFWHPVPLLSDLCLKSAVQMQILMV